MRVSLAAIVLLSLTVPAVVHAAEKRQSDSFYQLSR